MGFFKSLLKEIAGEAIGDIAGDAVGSVAEKAASKATEKAVDHLMSDNNKQQTEPAPQQQVPQQQAPQQQATPAPQQQTNSGMLYDPALENLINVAVADGELTEKEKQILFRKAEAAGIDLDEFEMVLEARLFEKKQEMQAKAQTQALQNVQIQQAQAAAMAPKPTKSGEISKCPGCGAMIEAFSTHCPQCGYEFNNREASASFTRLMNELKAAEATRTTGSDIRSAMFGQAFGDPVTNKKKTIISNFPIPNTKADILEFVTMAAPLAVKKGGFMTQNHPDNKLHNDLVGAWQDKLKQVVMKARFSMKEDKKTLAEIEDIVRQCGVKI